jgi:hypothetical protein
MGGHHVRALVVLGLTSCIADEPEPSYGEVESAIRCDEDFCGTNSPLMSVHKTWEFNIRGLQNDQGFVVLGLGKSWGGNEYFFDLRVNGGEIQGDWYGWTLARWDLVGARLYLGLGSKQFAIVISAVGEYPDVAGQRLESYVLDWADVVGQPLPRIMHAGDVREWNAMAQLGTSTNVCPDPKWSHESYVGSMIEWDESINIGMSMIESLVYEGDRFNPETRTLKPYDTDWFNIGCAAHSLVKLRISRNTINQGAPWQNVQAAFKMLGADYCGGGKSFTFPGEPLIWRDRAAMDYIQNPYRYELEARWDENGATCIRQPRLAITGNPAALPARYLWHQIGYECQMQGHALPRCADLQPYSWETSNELVTSVNWQ